MKANYLFVHTYMELVQSYAVNISHFCYHFIHFISLSLSLSLPLVPGDAPSITSVMVTDFSSIFLIWQPPSIPNGEITHYTITTLPSTPSQPLSLNGSLGSYEIQGLMAFTNYTIFLSASTSAGEGPADTTQEQTLEDGKRLQNLIFVHNYS
jgi:hypothetical protein